MSVKSYATNLASEFYVLSLLYRLGFDASLTLGNKKAVDIVVVLDEGRAVTIDVKAVAGRSDWLLGNHDLPDAPGHFVTLVGYEGAFADAARPPRLWLTYDRRGQLIRRNPGRWIPCLDCQHGAR